MSWKWFSFGVVSAATITLIIELVPKMIGFGILVIFFVSGLIGMGIAIGSNAGRGRWAKRSWEYNAISFVLSGGVSDNDHPILTKKYPHLGGFMTGYAIIGGIGIFFNIMNMLGN